ncbi:MAG: hypothetical protein ACOYJB_10595 [Christensenellaceae bacterium]|jgi:hypothetical protein
MNTVKQELLSQLYIETRLQKSREDFNKNGGISNSEARQTMRNKRQSMIEGLM